MKKLLLLLLGAPLVAQAQTKIGNNPTSINANAILELESANKGLLLPRMPLASTDAAAPLTAHVAGMIVYNTAAAGTGSTAVTPGYYFNDGTKWVRLNDVASAATIYNSDGTISNNRTVNLGGKNLYFNGPGYMAIGGNATSSTLDVNGSFAMPTRIVSSGTATTLDSTDHTLIITPAVGTFTVTLPAASGVTDREYTLVNQSITAKTVSTYYDLNGVAQTSLAPNTTITVQADASGKWTETGFSSTGVPGRVIASGTATTLTENDHTIILTPAVTTFAITLPSPAAVPNREYTLVNESATAKTISTYYDFSGAARTALNANSSITLQADASGKWYQTAGAVVTGSTVPGTLAATYEVMGAATNISAGSSAFLAGDSVTFTLAAASKVVITGNAYMIPHLTSGCPSYTFAEGIIRTVLDGNSVYSRYLCGYQYGSNTTTAAAVPVPATFVTDEVLAAGTHTIRLQATAWGTVSQSYNFQSNLLSSAPATITGNDLNATRTTMVVQVYNQ